MQKRKIFVFINIYGELDSERDGGNGNTATTKTNHNWMANRVCAKWTERRPNLNLSSGSLLIPSRSRPSLWPSHPRQASYTHCAVDVMYFVYSTIDSTLVYNRDMLVYLIRRRLLNWFSPFANIWQSAVWIDKRFRILVVCGFQSDCSSTNDQIPSYQKSAKILRHIELIRAMNEFTAACFIMILISSAFVGFVSQISRIAQCIRLRMKLLSPILHAADTIHSFTSDEWWEKRKKDNQIFMPYSRELYISFFPSLLVPRPLYVGVWMDVCEWVCVFLFFCYLVFKCNRFRCDDLTMNLIIQNQFYISFCCSNVLPE